MLIIHKLLSSCAQYHCLTGAWSEDGCRFVDVTKSGDVTCECNHLTNFACLVVSSDRIVFF